jgi:hydroxyethylthiazole kinase-like uncharacterized protein yjeF
MPLRRITQQSIEPLHGVAQTRALEQAAATRLPVHVLMGRAGLAVAQLAQALTPHARCIWVACGPGNNGGDGLIAATHLHQWALASGHGLQVVVTLLPAAQRPADAAWALAKAQAAGVQISEHPPETWDLSIDALLGIGVTRSPDGVMADRLSWLHHSNAPCLCVDVPSGLDADNGRWLGHTDNDPTLGPAGERHTLALLTLKPGLFTHRGRDLAGQVWFDDLQCPPSSDVGTRALLAGRPDGGRSCSAGPHSDHKGSRGDVVVIGGQDIALCGAGMTGAAVLAARAALHAGAGRVLVGLLEGADSRTAWDPVAPELMFRHVDLLLRDGALSHATTVCGCGGGQAVTPALTAVLSRAPRLVLDADALNAIATDEALQRQLTQRARRAWITVLTPHPLEAARLLGTDTARVMADRLLAADELAERFQAVCVLKGSGTVIAAPGKVPMINPTGNAALATAGTGDVLAGLVGAALAAPELTSEQASQRVATAVYQHGWLADHWSPESGALSASRLAERVRPVR